MEQEQHQPDRLRIQVSSGREGPAEEHEGRLPMLYTILMKPAEVSSAVAMLHAATAEIGTEEVRARVAQQE